MLTRDTSHFVVLHGEMATCMRCALHAERRQVVPGEGPWDADVMLIGEAPGASEDAVGRPFIGAAGKMLDRCLSSAGLDRGGIYITNVVKCRPPGNAQPTDEQRVQCFYFLEKQLAFIDPSVTILCGATALNTFWRHGKITKVHGEPFLCGGRLFLPTFHTAAALRNPKLIKVIIEDLRGVHTLLRKGATKGVREVPVSMMAYQNTLVRS